ncbi:SDR family oxidoreductase [Microbacterium invictum]|uniref:SDR family oxidoreductase n=1 Tax=Microbacterium invictum TaxID=515415 RepID=A0ABZ0V8W6_9MICO|nr:SDR family oxidoreductase [Microbacterium invictum]WQB69914.1 SDR family oxidoreductase [Microbacterium invictum]
MSSIHRRALVVGASGIAGQTVSRQLIDQGWEVHGLARRPGRRPDGVRPITVDLLDPDATATALAGIRPEIVIVTAWIRKDTEAQNIEVNTATLRNLFAALEPDGGVRHVALLTGLKHYLGPFEDYATGVKAETPFHESEPRLPSPNFYYAQEDVLFEAAEKLGFTWSVHRSHTVFGFAVDNAMNMVLTLSVYATLCRELDRPFVFPGSIAQWNFVTDVTDADLLGEQLVWAATHPEGENEAFNIANGDQFRWRWLWPQIADHFNVAWAGPSETPLTLEEQMTALAPGVWTQIAEREGLAEPDVTKLASWWHSDSDLGREVECLTDMTKSREAGFLNFRSTPKSFFDKVDRYREARLIP